MSKETLYLSVALCAFCICAALSFMFEVDLAALFFALLVCLFIPDLRKLIAKDREDRLRKLDDDLRGAIHRFNRGRE